MSSASSRSPSAVEPTRSQNRAVMTFRSSRIGATSSLAPHSLQNFESSGFSRAQEGQVTIGASLRRLREPAQGTRCYARRRDLLVFVDHISDDLRKRGQCRASNSRPSS